MSPKFPLAAAAGETDGGTTSSIAPGAALASPLRGTGVGPLPTTSKAASLAQQKGARSSLGRVRAQGFSSRPESYRAAGCVPG